MIDCLLCVVICDVVGYWFLFGWLFFCIGCSKSNDMVLLDGKVSFYYVVIVNIGESFMIIDL